MSVKFGKKSPEPVPKKIVPEKVPVSVSKIFGTEKVSVSVLSHTGLWKLLGLTLSLYSLNALIPLQDFRDIWLILDLTIHHL